MTSWKLGIRVSISRLCPSLPQFVHRPSTSTPLTTHPSLTGNSVFVRVNESVLHGFYGLDGRKRGRLRLSSSCCCCSFSFFSLSSNVDPISVNPFSSMLNSLVFFWNRACEELGDPKGQEQTESYLVQSLSIILLNGSSFFSSAV